MAIRHVTPREGGWQIIDPAGHDGPEQTITQSEAVSVAQTELENAGGGELVIHGTDGHIHDKRTIPPAHNPYPPPG
jgi:hypothetical protein